MLPSTTVGEEPTESKQEHCVCSLQTGMIHIIPFGSSFYMYYQNKISFCKSIFSTN